MIVRPVLVILFPFFLSRFILFSMLGLKNHFYVYNKSVKLLMYEVTEISPKGIETRIVAENLSKKEAQDLVKILSFSSGTLGKKLPKNYVL